MHPGPFARGLTVGWRSVLGLGLLVMGLAVWVRLPSCGESFWLDELHSTWAVSGGFSSVSGRAALGNQTPFYFQLLWVWQAIFGDSETALRMSSVLLSSLAAAGLAMGCVARTKSVAAGLVAGGVLALDANAIFFGTELRPYGAVLFCMAMAIWFATGMMEKSRAGRVRSGDREGLSRDRFWMVGWMAVAALMHPTSLGVTALFAVMVIGSIWGSVWWGRLKGDAGNHRRWDLRRVDRWDWGACAVVGVAGLLLAMSSLPESWSHRDRWRAFALATEWGQFWNESWSWWPLVGLPLVFAMIGWWFAMVVRRWPKPADRIPSQEISRPFPWETLLAGVGSTALFFLASYWEWVPLWQRRYFIAALPLLAWAAGQMVVRCAPTGKVGHVISMALAVLVVSALVRSQGSYPALWWHESVERRGEDWRGAVAWLEERRDLADEVWLDSGLIEASFLVAPRSGVSELSEAQWGYLAFPVSGSYPLGGVEIASVGEHRSWTKHRLGQIDRSAGVVHLLSRGRSDPSLDGYRRRVSEYLEERSRRRFGRIVVVEYRVRAADSAGRKPTVDAGSL